MHCLRFLNSPALLYLFLLTFITACGGPGPSSETMSGAPPARELSQNKTYDNGKYVVYFNVINSDTLGADIARKYEFKRSKNHALINVSVHAKNSDDSTTPTTAVLNANISNLTGQLKSVDWKNIKEENNSAIYYLGLTRVSNGETLIIDMNIIPDGESNPIPVKFQQKIYTD